ncbi:hypothetical protein [Massilia violaceinigra]|nr:hypothetical protein [Massilia violaceinigra]
MSMRLLSLAVAVAAGMLCGDTSAQRLPDGFFPESLAVSKDGTMYAGSATQSAIVRVAPGASDATPFIAPGSGLLSVQGLLVDDEGAQLFACSADLGVAQAPKSASALFSFDLASGALRGRWELPEGGFCNDIARGPDGNLYISDTASARVLKFDLKLARLSVWSEHPLLGGAQFNGNGIVFDGRVLYLSTFSDGRLLRIPMLADSLAGVPSTVKLPRALAGADALRYLAPGKLVVFENDIGGGNGRVTVIEPEGATARLTTVAEGLDEPVSGIVNGRSVVIVESQFRKLFGDQRGMPPAPFRLRTIRWPVSPDDLTSIALPEGTAYPNGIAAAADGTLYLGLIDQGRLLRRNRMGAWSTLLPGSKDVFAGTTLRLDAARSLLWGASPDFLPHRSGARLHRIFSVDLRTRRLRDVLPLPDAGFGNDIALTPQGHVLVTDSVGGRVLEFDTTTRQFKIIIDHPLLTPNNGIGAAGIARAHDGRLVIGNYGTGKLLIVDSGALHQIELPRLLENPDGLAFSPDGALIVLEGAVTSGEGKISRIPDPFAKGRRVIEVIATGLDSPTNLSIAPDGTAYVTESRIRRRLIKMKDANETPTFRIFKVPV